MRKFKCGDMVVFNESDYFTGVYGIDGWSAYGVLNGEVFISGGRRVHESVLRHATRAEVRARHRLDDNITDNVADIKYHVSPNMRVIE